MTKERAAIFFRVWLPVLLWMGVIFSLSSVPGEHIPKVPVPYVDKVGHLFEYGILGALLIRALLRSKPGMSPLKLSVLAVTVAFLYGISDEWHQVFVPGRSSEWAEVLLDGLFSMLGIGVFLEGRRHAGGRRAP